MSLKKPVRLFNLDLHISVIEDIKTIFESLFGSSISITNWSISGHNWVFQKPTPHVQVIHQKSWFQINDAMIEQFQKTYDHILRDYDGFIVTHTPVFAMLFEKYEKPILIVNTCRFNQPFCVTKDFAMEMKLHSALQRMVQKKQVTLVSNNMADRSYLLGITNLPSLLIPSLCRYVKASYQPTKDTFVLYGDRRDIFPPCNILVEKPKRFTWEELFSYRGIVHVPYEMSTMSIFEHMWSSVPLFFPTKRFYKECYENGLMKIISSYNKANQKLTEEEQDMWLNLADFYIYPFVYYYDSFDDLFQQLQTFTDPHKEKRDMWVEKIKEEVHGKWREIVLAMFPVLE